VQASPNPVQFAPSPAPLPLSMAATLVDAAVPILAYVVLLGVCARPLRGDDLLVVLVVTMLSFPGSLTFRRFSSDMPVRLAARWGVLLVLMLLYAVISGTPGYSAPLANSRFFTIAWGVLALLAVLATHVLSPGVLRLAERLRKRRKVVIVGINGAGVRLGQAISLGEAQGQELAGYFDDRTADRQGWLADRLQRLGSLADVGDYVRRHGVSRIYVTLPGSSAPRMTELLRQMQDSTASVYFVPDISMAEVIQCRVSLLAGLPVVAVCETPLDGGYGAFKRTLDLSVTVAALPVLLPLMALIALLVRATSPGPAIFKQRRYGLDGEEIVVWKFRTMTTLEDGSSTYRQATREDQRITPLGRFLRRTSLDELPQFLNVLAGSMSIVGPRPHALAVNEQCRKLIPGYMLRHKVKPGITGWAQVNGHRGGDDLEALRKRTEWDIRYLKSWSLGLDLLIMWKTAVLLLGGDKNAY